MSEAALSGGAPAPAEASVAVVAPHEMNLPNELGPQTPVAEKPAAKEPPKSVRETLSKASEQVKAKAAEKDAKPDVKAEPKAKVDKVEAPKVEAKARDETTGRFQPKDGAGKAVQAQQPAPATPQPGTHHEPPSRFSADAKAEWANAPDSVKGEVHRAMRELDAGIAKYKPAAEKYETVRDFAEAAEKVGLEPRRVIENYMRVDRMLKQDFVGGIEHLCERKGITLRQFAEHVLNKTPDQVAASQDKVIGDLRREISGLKDQIGGVTRRMSEDQQASVLSLVQQFAADHPRFDELSPDITKLLKTGMAADLAEAYSMAERLSPAPQSQAPLIPEAKPAAAPLNPAGQKSITGAPSSGSDPAAKRKGPAPTIREALKHASSRLS